MTVIQQIKKERRKKDEREKKNQIKLPGNEAYNFFSLIVSNKWQFTVCFDVVMFSIISEKKKSQIIKLWCALLLPPMFVYKKFIQLYICKLVLDWLHLLIISWWRMSKDLSHQVQGTLYTTNLLLIIAAEQPKGASSNIIRI